MGHNRGKGSGSESDREEELLFNTDWDDGFLADKNSEVRQEDEMLKKNEKPQENQEPQIDDNDSCPRTGIPIPKKTTPTRYYDSCPAGGAKTFFEKYRKEKSDEIHHTPALQRRNRQSNEGV